MRDKNVLGFKYAIQSEKAWVGLHQGLKSRAMYN